MRRMNVSHTKHKTLLQVACIAGIVGVLTTAFSAAVSPVSSHEAENGTTQNVQTIVDNSASGGKAIRFGSAATIGWLSGASGHGIPNGDFAAWRGNSVPIAGTWNDNNTAQANLWTIQPQFEYGQWTGALDLAVGAIDKNNGESWAAAATGAYDARWTQSLNNLKFYWTDKQRGQVYVRFAHEWNGNWYGWNVGDGEQANFKAAWQRFYNLKQSIYPQAKLVFNTNANTVGHSYDWRTAWPGDAYVDVYSVDFYSNHWRDYPGLATDGSGAPASLLGHQQFAASHNKPFAVSEWGNNSDNGDSPQYMQFMHDFFNQYSSASSGRLTYEIYFNVIWNPNKFGIYPENQSLIPNAAIKYKDLF